MKDSKNDFEILASIEKHIEGLRPLLPKQAIVGVGEYPIKLLLKDPFVGREGTVSIFLERSSDDIYKWIPKTYTPNLVLGFEDKGSNTHFWYNVLPIIIRDRSVTDLLKKYSTPKLRDAIIFASVWDGVGSASIPSLTEKFREQNIDSLSIAILPSKIQPIDTHFNAYGMLQMCNHTNGATVLLLSRDLLETFEGVDNKGEQIKGTTVLNYILDIFLAKELLVQEISELSRTFNVKFFNALAVTAASFRVYGSLENMLDTALLKPLSSFDISNSSLLYVLLRMPSNLKEIIPRTKIELAITNWFKEKTTLQSIHISEPIYTEEANDRIDAILFIGANETEKMFSNIENKISSLKSKAVEEGLMTEDWRLPIKVEEEKPVDTQTPEDSSTVQTPLETIQAEPLIQSTSSVTEEPQPIQEVPAQEQKLVSDKKTTEIVEIKPEKRKIIQRTKIAITNWLKKNRNRKKATESLDPIEKEEGE
jgi:hypothetical protein